MTMKQGDRVWVSDISTAHACELPHLEATYICEYDGKHLCARNLGFGAYAYAVPALPEGYTPWYGGDCPVDGDVIVELVLRPGAVRETMEAKHCRWKFYNDPNQFDIMGYRVVKDYVDHTIAPGGSCLYYNGLQDVYRAPGDCNFLGYVSNRGELMSSALMWRDLGGMLRPYKADATCVEVRAKAVRMKR